MLIVSVLGAMPVWRYSRTWGYLPSTVAAVAFGTLILLAISGRL
jgi:hypothetical protein